MKKLSKNETEFWQFTITRNVQIGKWKVYGYGKKLFECSVYEYGDSLEVLKAFAESWENSLVKF